MSRFGFAMDKASSRIPKMGFGFRKPAKNTGTHSEGNSPRGGVGVSETGALPMTPTDTHSAPGSNSSSPNLSRSKSLRVPRSTYGLKSHSSSSIVERNQGSDEDKDEVEVHAAGRPQRNQAVSNKPELTYSPRPRSKTIVGGMTRSLLRSSCRSVSPRRALGERGGEEDDEVGDSVPSPQVEVHTNACIVMVFTLLLCPLVPLDIQLSSTKCTYTATVFPWWLTLAL